MNQEERDARLLDHSEIDAYAEAYRKCEGCDPRSWLRARNSQNAAGVTTLQTLGLLIRHHEALSPARSAAASPAHPDSRVGPEMSEPSGMPLPKPLESADFRNWLRDHHQLVLLCALDDEPGGMGDVYRAWHRVMKCEMIVKIPRDRHRRERFHREIELQAKLRGDHIAIARSSPMYGDMPVLVVDYIPGPSLRKYLNTVGRVGWRDAGAIIRQAALGLGHAHHRGVIHRDVKPGNLVRSLRDGRLYVIDWGLARDLNAPRSSDSHLTVGPVGTPSYCPPEQVVDASSATPASDLYGLGCTWYELIAGRTPFDGKNARALWRAHAEDDVPPLDPALGVPKAVEHLIRKLLDKDPRRRFESADELVTALDQCHDPDPDSVTVAVKRPVRRPWKPLAAVAAIALALAAATFWPAAAKPTALDLVIELSDTGPEPQRSGQIGKSVYGARQGDQVAIRASLSSPGYSYLISFRPDGHMEPCVPVREGDPPRRDAYPATPLDDFITLNDGTGLQAFAVVTSSQPLPAFRDWRTAQGPPEWRTAKADPGVVWIFNGRFVESVKADGTRGAGTSPQGALGAVSALAQWLGSRPGADSVFIKAFAVSPK